MVTARRVAQKAADHVDGRVSLVEATEHLGAPLHRVRVERDGQEFALIPGGRVSLGFDLHTWQPTAQQAADYAESREQGYGYGPDLRTHLEQILSAPRRVHLDTVLMAVEDETPTEPPKDTPPPTSAACSPPQAYFRHAMRTSPCSSIGRAARWPSCQDIRRS
ncbi:hypothetical protein SUDANB2_07200 [Streptomyces sp. enrichment culture]